MKIKPHLETLGEGGTDIFRKYPLYALHYLFIFSFKHASKLRIHCESPYNFWFYFLKKLFNSLHKGEWISKMCGRGLIFKDRRGWFLKMGEGFIEKTYSIDQQMKIFYFPRAMYCLMCWKHREQSLLKNLKKLNLLKQSRKLMSRWHIYSLPPPSLTLPLLYLYI